MDSLEADDYGYKIALKPDQYLSDVMDEIKEKAYEDGH